MRGEVLRYDRELGLGFIAGADGRRYAFAKADLRRLAPVAEGAPVEFQPEGERAREVFPVAAGPARPAAIRFDRLAPAGRRRDGGPWADYVTALTRRHADFRGRARRREYWSYTLFWVLTAVLFAAAGAAADAALAAPATGSPEPVWLFTLPLMFTAATLLPGVALAVRRLHDIGLPGWFVLLILVPSLGGLIMLVFALIPSQKRENRWGPVPEGIPVPPPLSPPSPGTGR